MSLESCSLRGSSNLWGPRWGGPGVLGGSKKNWKNCQWMFLSARACRDIILHFYVKNVINTHFLEKQSWISHQVV